jgi:hypothetical protein
MSLPGQIATTVKTKSQTLATLTKAGIIRPSRPDRLLQTGIALVRWGPTPAAAYTVNAARYPDEVAIVDEAGTLTFLEVHRRTNALAHAFQDAATTAASSRRSWPARSWARTPCSSTRRSPSRS